MSSISWKWVILGGLLAVVVIDWGRCWSPDRTTKKETFPV